MLRMVVKNSQGTLHIFHQSPIATFCLIHFIISFTLLSLHTPLIYLRVHWGHVSLLFLNTPMCFSLKQELILHFHSIVIKNQEI